MIRLERWDYGIHAPLVAKWFSARGLTPKHAGGPELYPKIGVVADDMAVGFLYRTDASGMGYLDNFISDPHMTHANRVQLMDSIILELCRISDEELNIKLLFACTAAPSLIRLGQDHGFAIYQDGYSCIVRKKVGS